MRRERIGLGLVSTAAIICLAIAPAPGQSGSAADDTSAEKGTTPRTPAGAGEGSTRRPTSTPPGSTDDGSRDSSGGATDQGGAAATRTTGAPGRAQPATTDPRLRDRLYNNVRAPGGTYSTEPLTEQQDLDKPLPQTETAQDDEFKILGSEDFDGFTAYAVNDADLFLDTLTDAQRRLVRVIRAGEIGNPYDLILVDDSVGVDIRVFSSDPWHGAGGAYYESGSAYYTDSNRSWWWGAYPLGYPSSHAARWGFSYGYGFGYGYGNGYGYSYPHRYYVYPYGYYYNGYRRYWGPIDSTYSPAYQSDPAQDTDDAQPTIELTTLELARALLRVGRVTESIELYRAHLKDDPEDTVAMRTLGAALIEVGQVGDGFAMVRLAYGTDPALASEPLDARLFESASRLREIVRRAVRAANKEESSSGWLAVTMLMQGQGRDRVALKNLAKAENQYLSDDIARALRQRLE